VRERDWAVVVPVKPLARAKSRLRAASLRVHHVELVLAMAQDTVAASLTCPLVCEVLVVTDDPRTHRAMSALGARVVPDVPATGLNPAVAYGAAHAAPEHAVAVLAADLPALRADELAAALRAVAAVTGTASAGRGFVADAAGSGTTLLAALPGAGLDPRFGAGSARAHDATGAVRLDGDWPSLRHDVDTLADLIAAARLGLGPHTAALVGHALAALATGGNADGQAGGPAGERA
jgi:2-phospho-L-lactate/phosphoenolpyruvate guanylyltransferase